MLFGCGTDLVVKGGFPAVGFIWWLCVLFVSLVVCWIAVFGAVIR